jgi:putative membrane protein
VSLLARALLALVAALHLYFLVLEMFLWRRPTGRRVFRLTEAQAESTATLAANQGLYNGFLAAGLLWAVWAPPLMRVPLATFFAGCVVVAGLFGAATVSRRILIVQALPAALALAAVWAHGTG